MEDLDELVRSAKCGDTLAMSALLDALVPYVGRICGSIALDAGEDAAQETLVIVFRKLRKLRNAKALHGWVRAIALREALRAARPPTQPLPRDQVEARFAASGSGELGVEIRDLLERLEPEHRAVLVLRELEGLSEAEVAELQGVARGTVKSRLHRARAAFRKGWQE